ncbi:hypothetical protein LXL04_024944 [Taraxacum kok-saghyz]
MQLFSNIVQDIVVISDTNKFGISLEMNPNGTNYVFGACRSSSTIQSFINLDNEEATSRPIGRHAAKQAGKGKAANSSSSSNSRLDEIFEKHIEGNQKSF